eukprot:jgi/Bigna1/90936/estExt_fgenesh1_pg.C_830045
MCDVKEPLLLILLPCALPREGDVKPTRMNVKATADANKRAIDRARTVALLFVADASNLLTKVMTQPAPHTSLRIRDVPLTVEKLLTLLTPTALVVVLRAGYSIVQEAADGHCLFRAIARQVKGSEEDHPKVRSDIASYLQRALEKDGDNAGLDDEQLANFRLQAMAVIDDPSDSKEVSRTMMITMVAGGGGCGGGCGGGEVDSQTMSVLHVNGGDGPDSKKTCCDHSTCQCRRYVNSIANGEWGSMLEAYASCFTYGYCCVLQRNKHFPIFLALEEGSLGKKMNLSIH